MVMNAYLCDLTTIDWICIITALRRDAVLYDDEESAIDEFSKIFDFSWPENLPPTRSVRRHAF